MDASSLISTALNELLTPSIKLSDVLLKIKAVGHFINNKELKDWAQLELTGYRDSGMPVPAYRKIGVVPHVNLIHEDYAQNKGWQGNKLMAAEYLDNDLREALTHRTLGQSIAEIEQLAESGEKAGENPRMHIPPSMAAHVSKKLYAHNGWSIYSAWQVVPLNHLTGLLTVVRSKLVDLLLDLNQLDSKIPLQSLQGQQAVNDTVSKALHPHITVTNGNVNYSLGDGAVQSANTGHNAQLNTASGETVTQATSTAQVASLQELTEQLKQAIARDSAFDDHREEMSQEVERIEVQLQKPEPKKGIVKRAFESLQDLAVKGAGVATGHAVYELLKQAPHLIEVMS
ncbi:MAG: hypothetical protein EOO61_01935 [Hymenobacter sp.]|jgi:hypothetical protein|uniref:AbiTii domain-containing protein n=1 Tax=Hymenobacter sp. BT559 TaxID=2795729 RepID=UPI00121E5557|nr:hypothetical protein [Hymenobacter sp. BT559]MBJ6146024.1 hypothetical protein [Hymenobacter sp. BT559]RZK44949.1 MAG: hypothetical protein EOO61_01935 [Hymenobacter sp.]